jgi:eukaryotic-like serine/threonine-protein kinase
MTSLGRALSGRYRLDAQVGSGGMATVYRAWDLELERPVAVKVLAPNLAADPAFASRFRQEARAMASVHHPAIVAIHDVGEADGEPYLVMELVEGESLAARFGRGGALSPEEVAPILGSVAAGLAAVHARGLVHRDVKPHNILLPAGGAGKLADFGLARGDETTTLTSPGTAVGTLGYLAPELLHGEPATPASDVYALGVVAYEGLTGQRPHLATSLAGHVEAQAVPPVTPSAVAPWLGTAFDTPLLAALGPAVYRPDVAAFGASLSAATGVWSHGGGVMPATGAGAAGTSEALPLDPAAPTEVVRITPEGGGDQRGRGRRAPARREFVLALWFGGGAVVLLLLGLAFAGSGLLGRSAATPDAGALSSSSPSPTPSSSPSPTPTTTPSPTPTASPTPSPTTRIQGAVAALDAYDRALANDKGGASGLKNKEARTLESLSGQVRSALVDGDLAKAASAAAKLVDETDRLARGLPDAAAQQLRDAAQAVQDSIATAQGR